MTDITDLTNDSLMEDDCEEPNCLFPASHETADGVRLCWGCYRKLCREWDELPEELRRSK